MKEYIVQAIEQETIDSFDTHNAPELIRCKDCKFFIGEGHCCKIRGMGRVLKPDDFCSDGRSVK